MIRSVLPILLALAVAACSGPSDSPDAQPPADASASCLAATEHSDLAWIQANVLTPSCAAFSSCHDSAQPEAMLDLTTEETSAAGLVGVDSTLEPGINLVEPGDPEQSYLMVILGHFGVDDRRIDPAIGTMPLNNALLCVEKRDAIARWIDSLPAAAP
jgi:hypothetical protein